MRFPLLRARFLTPLTALALGAALALPAYAEEGPEGGDAREKLKAQVEKVLRLMRANEDALLKASTQGGKTPTGPDIPLPDMPPQDGAQGQPEGSGSGGTGGGGTGSGGTGSGGTGSGGAGGTQGGNGGAGSQGEQARIAIEELLKGTQGGAGRIPVELEELIKMLPT